MHEGLAERYAPYVPRVVLRRLAHDPHFEVEEIDGTVVFVDLSGFTRLSERLARLGREGAECLVDAIDGTFAELLREAYANGGSLLKFGGDALLLLFEGPGHVERGCHSAAVMRRTLRAIGRIEKRGAQARLRMSVGVHTDLFPLFLVGQRYREVLTTGPAWTTVVEMEAAADAGEILLSPATAARLPRASVGPPKGPGRLLAATPVVEHRPPDEPLWRPDADLVRECLPSAVADHVSHGFQPPEHRNATIAFIHYEHTDAMIAERGPQGVASAFAELVDVIDAAAEEHRVTLLGTDVDADGGKFMLCAGAPTATGDDEERMLLAMRRVIEAPRAIPVRIGVNRGPIFAGAVGPPYRRTYTTMGDATNLAARLMARAGPEEVYVSTSVLDRSATAFDGEALKPFMVKGKAKPVHAWSLGPPLGRQARAAARRVSERFPLAGRAGELEVLTRAVADARAGEGRLVEIVGEAGLGKSRLIEELVDAAPDLSVLRGSCEAYTASVPYRAWREPLLQALGIPADAPPERVAADLEAAVAAADPQLEPWLPLIAIPFDVQVPETPEVERTAPEFRPSRLQRSLIRLLRTVLAEPTLLVIEDVHLMDRASADLLAALVQELPEIPWLVAVTRRDEDQGFTAPTGAGVVGLEPAPLSYAEALALAEVVTEHAPLPPSTLQQIAERSAGNPQFLRDLLRAAADGAEELPESIEGAALARIDRLAPHDRAVVRRAAVLGMSFETRLVPSVLDDSMPEPDAETWRRLGRYFVEEGDGRLRFRRAVVREVAYDRVPFATRRRLHAVVGAQLERELGDAAADQAAILSVHFAQAGEHLATWRYARLAADRASAEYAYADAAVLYRRALDAARQLPVSASHVSATWEALADAYAHTGDQAGARAALTAARRTAPEDVVRHAHLMHRHARVDFDCGHVRRAVRWAMRGLRLVEAMDAQDAAAARAHLVAMLGTIRHRAGRHAEAAEVCRRAIADAERAGDERALAQACFILDTALAYSGQAVDGHHFRLALAIYEKLGELDRQASVLNNMGAAAYWAGRWSDAVELYRGGAAANEAAGALGQAAYGDCNVAEVLSDQGRLDEAEPLLRRAMQVCRGTGDEGGAAWCTSLLGRLATRRGDYGLAETLLADATAAFSALGEVGDAAFADALRAEAAVHAGETTDALARADRLLRDHAGKGRLAPLLHRVRGLALAQDGDLAAAEGALGASLAEARLQDEDYEVALTLHAALALATRAGRPPDRRQVRERDQILRRLGVLALAVPPVASVALATGAMAASI
jgi:class 3 adenylate cyclase/tetratricopeptide (TPR) repeat protein